MPAEWKNFRIPPLVGSEIGDKDGEKTYSKPTKMQYTRWMVGVSKCLDAMNLMWLIPMALSLKFEGGIFPLIVHEDEADDFDSFIFQYIVLQMALDAGARNLPFYDAPFAFGHVEPNYERVIEQVKMFSSQLTS